MAISVGVRPAEGAEDVVLGSGLRLPSRFWATVDRDDLPYALYLGVAVMGDGRVIPTALSTWPKADAEPRPVSVVLDEIGLATLLPYVAGVMGAQYNGGVPIDWSQPPTDEAARAMAGASVGLQVAVMRDVRLGRRQRVTDEHLRAVARVYSEARASGRNERQAVMAHFGKAQTTAHRWISEAKSRGYIDSEIRPGGRT